MTERDDLEHRLGQGLRRWAEAGQASMDLEAYVLGKQARTVDMPAPRRRWLRWAGSVAASVALLATMTATFPRWAGAAAGWPLVGPVVTEIILKDAGLKWAYDEGLIQGTLAEAKDGNVSVRILGFVADQARTTLIYQITGWQEPAPAPDQPQPAHSGPWVLHMSHPVRTYPAVAISNVNGDGVASWGSPPLMTPVGLVGSITSWPLEQETAPVTVTVEFGARKIHLDFTLHRSDKDSRSVTAGAGFSQRIKGVTVTVNSVSYTPAETLVRYTVSGPHFMGGIQYDGDEGTVFLESGGRQLKSLSSSGRYQPDGSLENFDTFPAVTGPARLVIPTRFTGVVVDLVWPLHKDATQEMTGSVITLSDWHQTGQEVGFQWQYQRNPLFGLDQVEVIDVAGKRYPVAATVRSTSVQNGREWRTAEGTIPEGVTPVAVAVKQAALRADGPWEFDLPR